MPYQLDPTIYGSANLYDLAVKAGTLQGEAGNQSVYGRAMVADNALNRAGKTSDRFFRNFDLWTSPDNQNSLSGAAAQMMGPYQYSTWLPGEAGAYKSATGMRDQILKLGQDPKYWDTLSPDQKQQITMNLDAIRGVYGSGELKGISGGATYYSTGNRAQFSDTTWRQHQGLGLGDALSRGKVDGEAWYGDNKSQVASINDAIRNFDRDPAARALTQRYDPNRPDDAFPGSEGVGGKNWWLDGVTKPSGNGITDALNNFSDSITGGVRAAGSALERGFHDLTGKLPGSDVLQKGVDDITSGASSLWDQLSGIAKSDDAQAFAKQTGLDPSKYVIDQAYRQATGRSADDPSLGWAGSVLQNQGGQSLFNALANSQEGRTNTLGQFYQNAFGRDIDPNGLTSGLDALSQGMGITDLERSLLGSQEAQQKGITADQFSKYLTNPSGFNGLASAANTIGPDGLTPTIGPDALTPTQGPGALTPTQGPTDWASILNTAFQGQLQRAPDQAALDYFGPQVQAGTLDEGMLSRLIQGTPEWKGMHSEDAPTIGAPSLTPTQGVNSFADLINQAYLTTLQRPADAVGSDYWTQALSSGSVAPDAIQQALTQSPEYAQTHPAPSGNYQGIDPIDVDTYNPLSGPQTITQPPSLANWQSVINNAFQTDLQRAPDAEALSFFGPQVQAGTLDAATLDRIIKASPEYLNMPSVDAPTIGPGALTPTEAPRLSQYRDTINNAYTTILNRPAETSALDAWLPQFQTGTLDQHGLEQAILQSPEYTATRGPDGYSPIIQNMYEAILGRAPDAIGAQTFQQQHDAGTSYGDIVKQMLGSQEASLRGIDASQYGKYLSDPMLVGAGGVTGFGNTNPANSIGGAVNPTATFRGFDPSAYLLANPDVANSSWATNPLGHYETFGYNEGRSLGNGLGPLGAGFDPTSYFNANPDVKAAGVDPLAHYLVNGAAEGRMATFSPDVGPYAFGKYSNVGGFNVNAGSSPAKGPSDNLPLGSGITYNGGGVQYGGVPIPSGGLFDPYASEQAYLNTQVDQINSGAQQAANVGLMLTGTNPNAGYVPMPVFAVNGTNQGNGGAVAANQGQYLNNVNTALAAMAPVAPAAASFVPATSAFRPFG